MPTEPKSNPKHGEDQSCKESEGITGKVGEGFHGRLCCFRKDINRATSAGFHRSERRVENAQARILETG